MFFAAALGWYSIIIQYSNITFEISEGGQAFEKS